MSIAANAINGRRPTSGWRLVHTRDLQRLNNQNQLLMAFQLAQLIVIVLLLLR